MFDEMPEAQGGTNTYSLMELGNCIARSRYFEFDDKYARNVACGVSRISRYVSDDGMETLDFNPGGQLSRKLIEHHLDEFSYQGTLLKFDAPIEASCLLLNSMPNAKPLIYEYCSVQSLNFHPLEVANVCAHWKPKVDFARAFTIKPGRELVISVSVEAGEIAGESHSFGMIVHTFTHWKHKRDCKMGFTFDPGKVEFASPLVRNGNLWSTNKELIEMRNLFGAPPYRISTSKSVPLALEFERAQLNCRILTTDDVMVQGQGVEKEGKKLIMLSLSDQQHLKSYMIVVVKKNNHLWCVDGVIKLAVANLLPILLVSLGEKYGNLTAFEGTENDYGWFCFDPRGKIKAGKRVTLTIFDGSNLAVTKVVRIKLFYHEQLIDDMEEAATCSVLAYFGTKICPSCSATCSGGDWSLLANKGQRCIREWFNTLLLDYCT